MTSQRCCFAGYAFHHVAIATHRIHVVVKKLEAGTIVICRQPHAGHRHSNAIAYTLAQWPGCSFYTRGQAIFGVSRRLAVNLPEFLDVVQSDGEFIPLLIFGIHRTDAGQVK